MQVAHCQAQGEASSSYGGADMNNSTTGVTIQDIDRSYTRKRKCSSGFTKLISSLNYPLSFRAWSLFI